MLKKIMRRYSSVPNDDTSPSLSSLKHGVIRRCSERFRKPNTKRQQNRHGHPQPQLTEFDYMILEDFQQRLRSLGLADDFVEDIRQSSNPTETFIRHLEEFKRMLERADRKRLSSLSSLSSFTLTIESSRSIEASITDDDLQEEEEEDVSLGASWAGIDIDSV